MRVKGLKGYASNGIRRWKNMAKEVRTLPKEEGSAKNSVRSEAALIGRDVTTTVNFHFVRSAFRLFHVRTSIVGIKETAFTGGFVVGDQGSNPGHPD
jgi:hypothetical protein